MSFIKHAVCLWLIFFATFFQIQPAFAIVKTSDNKTVFVQKETVTKARLETALGRKLTFSERLFLPIVQKKMHATTASEFDMSGKNDKKWAIAGFIALLVGLVVLALSIAFHLGHPLLTFGTILGGVGYAICYLVWRMTGDESAKKLAFAGILTGYISFTILAIAAFLGAMFLIVSLFSVI